MYELAFCKGAHVLTRAQPFAVRNIRQYKREEEFSNRRWGEKKSQHFGHSKGHTTVPSAPTQPSAFQRPGNPRGRFGRNQQTSQPLQLDAFTDSTATQPQT